eukprot:gene12175-12312_t
MQVDKLGQAVPLDAQATGLLIVLLGAATRLTPKFEPLERVYSGTLTLGVTQTAPWEHITDADIAAAAQQFTGEIQQLPALWSSTKYKNRPLWWYAQRGEPVVQQPKSGASVRVLVDDIGKVLGCGAHVSSLRRDSIGGFSVETGWSLEVLLPLAKKYAKGFRNAQ